MITAQLNVHHYTVPLPYHDRNPQSPVWSCWGELRQLWEVWTLSSPLTHEQGKWLFLYKYLPIRTHCSNLWPKDIGMSSTSLTALSRL